MRIDGWCHFGSPIRVEATIKSILISHHGHVDEHIFFDSQYQSIWQLPGGHQPRFNAYWQAGLRLDIRLWVGSKGQRARSGGQNPKRKQLTPAERSSEDHLRSVLARECGCKRKTCFQQFISEPAFRELLDYRCHWYELHKMDQDQFAPGLNRVFGLFLVCLSHHHIKSWVLFRFEDPSSTFIETSRKLISVRRRVGNMLSERQVYFGVLIRDI